MDTPIRMGQTQDTINIQSGNQSASISIPRKEPQDIASVKAAPAFATPAGNAEKYGKNNVPSDPPWPKAILASLTAHIFLLLGLYSFGEIALVLDVPDSSPLMMVSLGNGPAGSGSKHPALPSPKGNSSDLVPTGQTLREEAATTPPPLQEKQVQEYATIQQPDPNAINLKKDKIKPPAETRVKKSTAPQSVKKENRKNTVSEANTTFVEAIGENNTPSTTTETQQNTGSGYGGQEGQGGSGNASTGSGHADEEGYIKAHYEYIKKQIRKHLVYSNQAKRMGLQGTVTVSFTIAQDGSAHTLSIKHSSGYESLDESALAAVKNASPFTPPPKPARITIPIDFNLK